MIMTVTRSHKNPKAEMGMIDGIKKNMMSGMGLGLSGNL